MRETTIHWLDGGKYADISTCDKKLLAELAYLQYKPHTQYRDGSGEYRVPAEHIHFLNIQEQEKVNGIYGK